MAALAQGATLKVHRTMDGDKSYALYTLDDAIKRQISGSIVGSLARKRLIASNMKFPAATFLLTERGVNIVESMGKSKSTAVASRIDE